MELYSDGHTARSPGRAIVELDRAGRTYLGPPTVNALRPCSLAIDRGEYLSIMGRSGSGKSTLLNVLGLLDRPTSGRYRLDGVETSLMSERDRTRVRSFKIGFVFQSFHLLPYRTATENVEIGLLYSGTPRRDRRALAESALDSVGLRSRKDARPGELSGGEAQRVAIARAMAGTPDLLLCDEPTGNLDRSNSRKILDLIRSANTQGVTTIVITHDVDVANEATRLITMVDGSLRIPE